MQFDFGDDEPSISAAVHQALGAASTAWTETFTGPASLGRIGITERVFDSELAAEVGQALLEFIADRIITAFDEVAELTSATVLLTAARGHVLAAFDITEHDGPVDLDDVAPLLRQKVADAVGLPVERVHDDRHPLDMD